MVFNTSASMFSQKNHFNHFKDYLITKLTGFGTNYIIFGFVEFFLK
jgi:hypothetical protein